MVNNKSDGGLFGLIHSFCSEMKSKTETIFKIEGAADYYRWLNYVPDAMKERIDSLIEQSEYHLSSKETEELKSYFKERLILNQLESYFRGDILNFKYKDLNDYINNHPLSDIIDSRLTSEEIELAKKECEKLIKNNDGQQFGTIIFDDDESILDFAPDSMIDFYAMELYSDFCKKDKQERFHENTHEEYKRNAISSKKSKKLTK